MKLKSRLKKTWKTHKNAISSFIPGLLRRVGGEVPVSVPGATQSSKSGEEERTSDEIGKGSCPNYEAWKEEMNGESNSIHDQSTRSTNLASTCATQLQEEILAEMTSDGVSLAEVVDSLLMPPPSKLPIPPYRFKVSSESGVTKSCPSLQNKSPTEMRRQRTPRCLRRCTSGVEAGKGQYVPGQGRSLLRQCLQKRGVLNPENSPELSPMNSSCRSRPSDLSFNSVSHLSSRMSAVGLPVPQMSLAVNLDASSRSSGGGFSHQNLATSSPLTSLPCSREVNGGLAHPPGHTLPSFGSLQESIRGKASPISPILFPQHHIFAEAPSPVNSTGPIRLRPQRVAYTGNHGSQREKYKSLYLQLQAPQDAYLRQPLVVHLQMNVNTCTTPEEMFVCSPIPKNSLSLSIQENTFSSFYLVETEDISPTDPVAGGTPLTEGFISESRTVGAEYIPPGTRKVLSNSSVPYVVETEDISPNDAEAVSLLTELSQSLTAPTGSVPPVNSDYLPVGASVALPTIPASPYSGTPLRPCGETSLNLVTQKSSPQTVCYPRFQSANPTYLHSGIPKLRHSLTYTTAPERQLNPGTPTYRYSRPETSSGSPRSPAFRNSGPHAFQYSRSRAFRYSGPQVFRYSEQALRYSGSLPSSLPIRSQASLPLGRLAFPPSRPQAIHSSGPQASVPSRLPAFLPPWDSLSETSFPIVAKDKFWTAYKMVLPTQRLEYMAREPKQADPKLWIKATIIVMHHILFETSLWSPYENFDQLMCSAKWVVGGAAHMDLEEATLSRFVELERDFFPMHQLGGFNAASHEELTETPQYRICPPTFVWSCDSLRPLTLRLLSLVYPETTKALKVFNRLKGLSKGFQ